MTSATTTTILPTLRETYYPGETFQLYSHPPPSPPADKECRYEDSPLFPELSDRYSKSIEERITAPSTPPDVTITLKKRFDSSKHNIPHVWLAQVQAPSQTSYPPKLVAKIYDPVWLGDAERFDPFEARSLSVSQEVECYHRFEPLQGTKVPLFYGNFIPSLPSRQNRTVHVILVQCMPGDDPRHIVPRDVAGAVCAAHKNAIIEASLNLLLDLDAFGVDLSDFHPRNVILLPPKERREFCAVSKCPLHLKADCNDLDAAMIDFESIEFTEPRRYDDSGRRKEIDRSKPKLLEYWLEGRMG